MVSGTPFEGLDLIASLVYGGGAKTLVAYTNAQNTLGDASHAADLVQPTSTNGYAPFLLQGSWSWLNGLVTYTETVNPVPGTSNPGWSATGTWSATVNGYAIITGTTLLHYKDLAVPFTAAAGKKLSIDLTTVLS